MREFLSSIRNSAWQTAGARYEAARRLRRRSLISTMSLAFFSALTIVIAFLQRIYVSTPGSTLDNYLTTTSAGLGVFLLVVSLMEWGSANDLKADSLYRNAEDLNSHGRKIEFAISQLDSKMSVTWQDADDLRSEYEAIKQKCSYNHDPLDLMRFRVAKRFAPEFVGANGKPSMNWGVALWHTFRHVWSSIWFFALLWAIVLFSLYLAPWK